MGTLWKIAVRNTVRHGRRTIITALVLMAGIGIFIFVDTLGAGMGRSGVDNMADYALSSLKVRNPAYVEDIEASPLDKGLANPDEAVAALAKEGLPAAPRVRFVAQVSNYTDQIPVLAAAVDPKADSKVFRVSSSVSAGTWLAGAPSKSVVFGIAFAQELKLKVGDSVLISAQTMDDRTNADEYSVVGLVDTPVPEVNKNGLFMSLTDARALLDAPDLVTEVDAALPRAVTLNAGLVAADSAAERLRGALPGVRIDPIRELGKVFLADLDAHGVYFRILVVIILLIAAVGIVNTILMSVYSRVREIGILRAYGMVRRDIARLFTLEGLMVGIFGSLLGVTLGVGLDIFMIVRGIPAATFSGAVPWVSGFIHGEWNLRTMIVGFAFGVLVSFIASLIPARRAAKLEPTAALRFQ
ncbi:MAG: FtsX-like permease family protein [Spirochaetia bacterium]